MTWQAEVTKGIAGRFPTGKLVTTSRALAALSFDDITGALARHARGDWGDLDAEDRRANDHGLAGDGRLVSQYQSRMGVRFYIITEGDRSVTTVLLPEDY